MADDFDLGELLKYGVMNPVSEPNKNTYLPTSDSDGPSGNLSRVVDTTRENLFEGKIGADGEYNGIVLTSRKTNSDDISDESNNWNFFLNRVAGSKKNRTFNRVRVPEFHAMIPTPENEDDTKKIRLHDEFINNSDSHLSVGDIVKVSFYNSEGIWMPQVLEKINSTGKTLFPNKEKSKEKMKPKHKSPENTGIEGGSDDPVFNAISKGLDKLINSSVDKKSLEEILNALGYETGDPIFEIALAISTHEGWLPNVNDGVGSRSYRNNNPGNLNMSGRFKQYDSDVQLEDNPYGGNRFASFSTPIKGMRALIEGKIKKWARGDMPVTSGNQSILDEYTGSRWTDGTPPTIRQFFFTYAPPTDNNDTTGYINGVVDDLQEALEGGETIGSNTKVITILNRYGTDDSI